MTAFLSLCDKLAVRSGAIGASPVSVTNQTGRQKKCVDWVAHAWTILQGMYPRDWSFLQGEWSGTFTAGNDTYAAVTLGISDRFGSWKGDRPEGRYLYRPVTIYDPAIGVGDEGPLTEIPFNAWRERYDRGAQVAARPRVYAIAPDRTLRIAPVPDKDYAARGEYLKAPQVLAANADEPDMPSQFHDIIVDRAIILMDESDEAPAGLTGAIRNFQDKIAGMKQELLPSPYIAGNW